MNTEFGFRDFDKVCRLCLSFDDLQPFNESYQQLVATLTSIDIKQDKHLPENICNICTKQLENIINFVETCQKANETLKTISQIQQTSLELYNDGKYVKNCTINQPTGILFKDEFDSEYDDGAAYNSDGDSVDYKPVSCPNCGQNFTSIESLHEHYEEISTCRPHDYHTSVQILITADDEIKSEVEADIKKHFRKGKEIKGKRRFLCNYCGKNYTRKSGLDRHIMSHTGVKPFECKECGKRYITKDTLKTHILIHTGIKTHKCQICNKSFIQSSHLNYHMKRHAGEKPHSCSFCGKGFLSTYHLERHKLMHTGVKPYKCDLCDKQFVRSTTLRDHLLQHTGERPFQCQHCGKQFNRKQTLTNHVTLVHAGSEKNVNNNYSELLPLDEHMPKTQ